jgi:hypothetical protein
MHSTSTTVNSAPSNKRKLYDSLLDNVLYIDVKKKIRRNSSINEMNCAASKRKATLAVAHVSVSKEYYLYVFATYVMADFRRSNTNIAAANDIAFINNNNNINNNDNNHNNNGNDADANHSNLLGFSYNNFEHIMWKYQRMMESENDNDNSDNVNDFNSGDNDCKENSNNNNNNQQQQVSKKLKMITCDYLKHVILSFPDYSNQTRQWCRVPRNRERLPADLRTVPHSFDELKKHLPVAFVNAMVQALIATEKMFTRVQRQIKLYSTLKQRNPEGKMMSEHKHDQKEFESAQRAVYGSAEIDAEFGRRLIAVLHAFLATHKRIWVCDRIEGGIFVFECQYEKDGYSTVDAKYPSYEAPPAVSEGSPNIAFHARVVKIWLCKEASNKEVEAIKNSAPFSSRINIFVNNDYAIGDDDDVVGSDVEVSAETNNMGHGNSNNNNSSSNDNIDSSNNNDVSNNNNNNYLYNSDNRTNDDDDDADNDNNSYYDNNNYDSSNRSNRRNSSRAQLQYSYSFLRKPSVNTDAYGMHNDRDVYECENFRSFCTSDAGQFCLVQQEQQEQCFVNGLITAGGISLYIPRYVLGNPAGCNFIDRSYVSTSKTYADMRWIWYQLQFPERMAKYNSAAISSSSSSSWSNSQECPYTLLTEFTQMRSGPKRPFQWLDERDSIQFSPLFQRCLGHIPPRLFFDEFDEIVTTSFNSFAAASRQIVSRSKPSPESLRQTSKIPASQRFCQFNNLIDAVYPDAYKWQHSRLSEVISFSCPDCPTEVAFLICMYTL